MDGTQVQVPPRRCFSTIPPSHSTSVQQVQSVRNTGKSCWEGRDDGEVLSVEELSLQHYENEGWKGYVTFLLQLGSTHML